MQIFTVIYRPAGSRPVHHHGGLVLGYELAISLGGVCVKKREREKRFLHSLIMWLILFYSLQFIGVAAAVVFNTSTQCSENSCSKGDVTTAGVAVISLWSLEVPILLFAQRLLFCFSKMFLCFCLVLMQFLNVGKQSVVIRVGES